MVRIVLFIARHAVGCGAGIGAGTRRLRQVQMATRSRARLAGVAVEKPSGADLPWHVGTAVAVALTPLAGRKAAGAAVAGA